MTCKNPKQYNSFAKDFMNVALIKDKKIQMEKLNYLQGLLNQKLKKEAFKNNIFQSKTQAITYYHLKQCFKNFHQHM